MVSKALSKFITCLTSQNVVSSLDIWLSPTFNEDATPFYKSEISTLRSKYRTLILAGMDILRKDVNSLEIDVKSYMLPLLTCIGKDSLYNHILAQGRMCKIVVKLAQRI